MWLLVDAGNSSVKYAFYRTGTISEFRRRATSTLPERQPAAEEIVRSARSAGAARIGLASVVPDITRTVESLASDAGIPITKISAELHLPFESSYETPETLGADRISAVAGAVRRFGDRPQGEHLIVILAGTALTVEVIDPSNVYRGGIIMPGPDLSRQALSLGTAQLPAVPLEMPTEPIGRTTVRSIQSGLFYGMAGAVDGLLGRIAGDGQARVIICGGWADALHDELASPSLVDQELILRGIASLMELNPA